MLFLLFQVAIAFALLVFLAIGVANRYELGRLRHAALQSRVPFVSILVPARNEAHNIERCINSLLQQRYESFEVLVLDDGSTDATPTLLAELAQHAGGVLQVLQGDPLPQGWHGKAWACQQLGEAAHGDLLLFTDADTVHHPTALARSVAALQASQASMLSMTPLQTMHSWWEKIVVPLVYVVLMNFLPLRFVRTTSIPAFSFANGQFILIERTMYRQLNGHAAVRQQLVEDVWLCMAVKKAGGRVVAINGVDLVSCRMYRSGKEVWEGFSKNIFAGLGYYHSALFGLLALIALFYIIPIALLTTSVVQANYSATHFWLPLVQVVLAFANRWLVAFTFHQSRFMVFFHPLTMVAFFAIACNSWYWIVSGKGAGWKGRRYQFTE
uniref:Glycosyl transferase n=1 Tax=Chlorobium chlorochromatii (strain CaD3) TaxID=340177 RepID=Q3AU35_CHLCH